ncbi:hypothetical protein DL96DRAFT_214149 [Flagelloscypha sp. PMI_526]|nr:hypothetical protein DL96DRAFT_214149 [Flagelloscypha sp. PMI_526]
MLFSTKTVAVTPSLLTHKADTHLPDLPLEIIEKIIYSVEDIPTAFHLLTTCRALSCLAEAALYHTIDFTTIRNGPMERVVFRRWSGLLRHLLESPRHAAMVFYICGTIKCYNVELSSVKVTQGGLFTDHQTPPTSLDLNFHLLLAKLPHLRKLIFPRDPIPLIRGIADFSSNNLRELFICFLPRCAFPEPSTRCISALYTGTAK